MTPKAKRLLILVGAILIASYPLSRWVAATNVRITSPQYFSAAIIEIKPDSDERRTDASGTKFSGRPDPQYLAAQFQVIKSSEILTPVIEKLDLVTKLSPPGMIMPMEWVTERFSRCIVVEEQRNTTLVEIGVYHTDRELAATIANQIAVTYRDKRIEPLRRNVDATLAEMKDELMRLRVEFDTLSQETARIRQENRIVDPDPESPDAKLSFSEPQDKAAMDRYVEKKSAYVTAKQRLLALEQRHAAARMDNILLPHPVKIWQRAVPALRPQPLWLASVPLDSLRPDMAAALSRANLIGGCLAGIGIGLILIALCMKTPKAL